MKHLLILPTLLLLTTCSSNSGTFSATCDTKGANLKHVTVTGNAPTNGVEYHISIAIDGMPMEAIADTGSSNLIVANDIGFTPSSTGTPVQANPVCGYSICYGSGSANLISYTGAVNLDCGPGVSQFTYDYIQPGATINTTLLGLAYRSIESPQDSGPTFFEQLTGSGMSDEFAMLLCGYGNNNSSITFGGLNSASKTSDFTYVPIKLTSWYVINGYGVSTSDNHTVSGGSLNNYGHVIVDSGTTLVLLPPGMFADIVNYLSSTYPNAADWAAVSAGGNLSACPSQSRLATLPNVNIALDNNFTLSISPNKYFKQNDHGCFFGFAEQAPPATGGVAAILGQVAMENYYVHFNRKAGQIGFGPNTLCNN